MMQSSHEKRKKDFKKSNLKLSDIWKSKYYKLAMIMEWFGITITHLKNKDGKCNNIKLDYNRLHFSY